MQLCRTKFRKSCTSITKNWTMCFLRQARIPGLVTGRRPRRDRPNRTTIGTLICEPDSIASSWSRCRSATYPIQSRENIESKKLRAKNWTVIAGGTWRWRWRTPTRTRTGARELELEPGARAVRRGTTPGPSNMRLRVRTLKMPTHTAIKTTSRVVAPLVT